MKKGIREPIKVIKDIPENKSLLNLLDYKPLMAYQQSKASTTSTKTIFAILSMLMLSHHAF